VKVIYIRLSIYNIHRTQQATASGILKICATPTICTNNDRHDEQYDSAKLDVGMGLQLC